jgi:hypothetical protein
MMDSPNHHGSSMMEKINTAPNGMTMGMINSIPIFDGYV